MEVAGAEGRRPVGRVEASPERGRPAYASSVRPAPARPMRKVQIIYYLCRNGQLEHPHFMELAQHPHQPLRLKDVMDRLTLLRGKGMPALFSWSCKRNYKNGYVWNDLSENDVIYPSDGVEYVLKGSEIFPGCSSDRFQHLRVTDRSPTKPLALPHSHKQYMDSYRDDAVEDPEDDELGYQYHRRPGAARLARPDKPVSARTNRGRPVELPVEETSPPSSTSSDKPPPAIQQPGRADQEPEPNRPGSMLLQLIACGSTAATGGSGPRLSCGLVSRLSSRAGVDEEEAAGGELSRRFGHLAVEDKEYFSGSIVEGSGGRGTPLPASSHKRSNSYNEERSSRLGVGAIGGERVDEQTEGDEGIRGRCIPGRKKQQPQK
ncbi:protein SOSEKI 2-like [Phragmites australis]|uniref:protein SOSEKI 2-like n=1 Tax=Phragmites australis TaxID=29695 RepID=UPI002D77AEF7|nr:protein SOSEKI 2-like [Phragmites australis]